MSDEVPMTHAAALLALHRELSEGTGPTPDVINAIVMDANRIVLSNAGGNIIVKRYGDV